MSVNWAAIYNRLFDLVRPGTFANTLPARNNPPSHRLAITGLPIALKLLALYNVGHNLGEVF